MKLMQLMQFLMGLDDSYMAIRSNILSRDPLHDVRGAYVIISSEESHRVVSTSNVGISQRPNNVTRPSGGGNRRTNGGPQLVCENCGFNGHTIDRCFKLIGYPADFGKRNNNNNNSQGTQNFNRRFINNNSVGSSSSSTFSDDQLSKIISLIKDNSLNNGKGVQANMAGTILNKSRLFHKNFNRFFSSNSQLHSALVAAGVIVDSGANQHLTYTDKFLVDVINISNLGIKVSHPNGTEAVITSIGNMVLTKNLTLYDVLVVPEYCVSLMSVHKVARDSGLIVAFNENKCFVLPQDLREMKILGTGNQIDGLYYFNDESQGISSGFEKPKCNLSKYIWHNRLGHPSDQVLRILEHDLAFDNSDLDHCEICQKSKQTREPFPLSEHKSSVLAELVHLDLWGPYRVTSKYRQPLSWLGRANSALDAGREFKGYICASACECGLSRFAFKRIVQEYKIHERLNRLAYELRLLVFALSKARSPNLMSVMVVQKATTIPRCISSSSELNVERLPLRMLVRRHVLNTIFVDVATSMDDVGVSKIRSSGGCMPHVVITVLGSNLMWKPASTNTERCQLDDLIKMWILISLCDSLQEQVITTPGNAKALWDHLKNLFHDNKDARAINLDNELRSIKIGKIMVNEYCTKIQAMANRLKNLDCEVSEKNMVIFVVNGLDSRLATLAEIIHHREPLPTFEMVRNMLLLKKSSYNDDSTSTTFESSSSSLTILMTSSSSNTKGLLPEKFYNSLGSALNRCSVVWARLGVVYRSLEEKIGKA
ncbi:ribonuclease H-like domain-containing protein [Tanacetum coccineum]